MRLLKIALPQSVVSPVSISAHVRVELLCNLLTLLQAEKAKHVRLQRTDNVNLEEAERAVQRAFVIRAQTFGLDHPGTKKARENLLKCYYSLGKTEEVRVLRDVPQMHFAHLKKVIDEYDEEVRLRLRLQLQLRLRWCQRFL